MEIRVYVTNIKNSRTPDDPNTDYYTLSLLCENVLNMSVYLKYPGPYTPVYKRILRSYICMTGQTEP